MRVHVFCKVRGALLVHSGRWVGRGAPSGRWAGRGAGGAEEVGWIRGHMKFGTQVDIIIDNKKFEVATNDESRLWQAKSKVRHQIRTRAEGLLTNYTKPNVKRNRRNLGGSVNVCAGISKNRIVLWKYLTGRWNGEAAANIFAVDIKKVFKRNCPDKARPTILEDNDPTGYKSGVAVATKRRLKYNVLSLPRYSPDLNPLDYCIWTDIERRAMKGGPKNGKESVEDYKAIPTLSPRFDCICRPSVSSCVEWPNGGFSHGACP